MTTDGASENERGPAIFVYRAGARIIRQRSALEPVKTLYSCARGQRLISWDHAWLGERLAFGQKLIGEYVLLASCFRPTRLHTVCMSRFTNSRWMPSTETSITCAAYQRRGTVKQCKRTNQCWWPLKTARTERFNAADGGQRGSYSIVLRAKPTEDSCRGGRLVVRTLLVQYSQDGAKPPFLPGFGLLRIFLYSK
jgi:hypothetical protein